MFIKEYKEWLTRIDTIDKYGVFFILGAQRSGTTWLQHILAQHPEIVCDLEVHFQVLLNLLRDSFIQFNSFQKKRLHRAINPKNIIFGDREIMFVIKLIIDSQLAKRASSAYLPKWVGDKTPEYAMYCDIFKIFYPKSKVIHIIRDGRDCVVSCWFHVQKGKNNPFKNLKEFIKFYVENNWVPYIKKAREFGAKYPQDYIEVRYEDLWHYPHQVIERIFNFLKVKIDREIINRCIENTSFKILSGGREPGIEDRDSDFRKGIIGDWKNHMDPSAYEYFKSLCGDMMEELGYKL